MLIKFLRVIINRIKFLFLGIHCKGKCTSFLSCEWKRSKHGTISLGVHFCSLKNCRIIANAGKIIIGNNVGLSSNCIVSSHKAITISDGVEIGPNVCIYDHDHDFKSPQGIKSKQFKSSEVFIGKNVWIGANVVILRGTVIGDNCVIGAGTIVKETIPPNMVVVNDIKKKYILYEKN